jgi:hypothetical protein
MKKTVAQVEAAEDRQTVHAMRVGALRNKLVSLGARHIAMTTGPDKGPMDWYELNGQPIIVHLYADQGGYEVYAPAAGASLSVSDTFDALDRIANPQPLTIEEMHSIAPTGGTIAATQPTAADRGAARGVIAEMEHGPRPQDAPGYFDRTGQDGQYPART